MRTLLLIGILLLCSTLLYTQEIGVNRNTPVYISSSAVTLSVDETKAVGEIPLQQSVSNGALTYSVPIDVYPGRNDLSPKISISYNSMMQYSSMGRGWFLGGLS